jgi:hypothetical protein
MSMAADFRAAMPGMLVHEGTWEGVYRHVARDGTLIDQHQMRTECAFPLEGPYVYVQSNWLSWADGRTEDRSFGGAFHGGLLHWDTDRFHGIGWETLEGTLMLRLTRKDLPGTHFIEMINLSADGQSRARTWQWFENGVPTRRTLCDEWRVA